MTNDVLTREAISFASSGKSTYGYGGWGQPATEHNKNYFLSAYPKNYSNEVIRRGIMDAPEDYAIVDCVCSIKSLLDSCIGKDNQTAEDRQPCPDITIEKILLTKCVDVTTNFDNILIGEFVSYADYSHCGLYVGIINGKRYVAEATHRFANGFQLIDMDCAERKDKWRYHGKMWLWVDYTFKGASLFDTDVSTLRDAVNKRLSARKGNSGNYVKEIQLVLIGKGYSCGSYGADGKFGANTELAVKKFQNDNSLVPDGIVGFDTISALLNS